MNEFGASIQSHYQADKLIDDEIYNVLIWDFLKKGHEPVPTHFESNSTLIRQKGNVYSIMYVLENKKKAHRRIENTKTVMKSIVDVFLDEDDTEPLTVRFLAEKTGYSPNSITEACKRLVVEKRIEKVPQKGQRFSAPRPEISYQIVEELTHDVV